MAVPEMFERLEPRLLLTTLPAGFSEAQVTTGLNSATAMEFSPTGELWVLEQAGAVNLVRGDGTRHTAINLVVNSGGERGLLGIAFDSAYDGAGPNTDYAFLYYTATTPGTHNRVSRFTITGAGTDTPTLGSESIILEIEPEAQGDNSSNHNGDELIITVNIPDLDPGEFFTDTIAIQLPLATLNARALADDPPGLGGNHQSTSFDMLGIIVDAGDDNAESNEANNLDQGNGIDKDDVTYFPWDIDGNGVITPTDAIFFINRLGQNVPPADGRADPDGSGDVTPTDAIAAINRLTYLRNDGVIDADPIARLNSGVSAANEFSALLIDAHQVANNRSRGRIGQWLDSDDDEPVFDVFDQFT